MKTLIYPNPINYSTPQYSSPLFLFHFPSFSLENRKFLKVSHNKFLFNSKSPNVSPFFKACSASYSVNYGGWDNFGLGGESVNSVESDQLRSFLISIGLNDKKYVFVFLFGFVCALAISRVRLSSIVVFPASALVFAIGFSIGFVRGGLICENGGKKRSKEEIFMVYNEKLRILLDFFDRLEVKVGDLKNDILKAIDSNKVTVNNLDNYVNVIESIRSSALTTKNVIEASIDVVENSNGLIVDSQKSSRKKKEVGEVGFELRKFFGGLFGEKVVNLKPSKVKDNAIKRGSVETLANDQANGTTPSSSIEERVTNTVNETEADLNSDYSQELSWKAALNQDGDRRIKIGLDDEEMNLREMGGSSKSFIDNREYHYHNYSLSNMHGNKKTKSWKSDNNLLDSVDFSVSFKHVESEASFVQERMLSRGNGAYRSPRRTEGSRNETYGSSRRTEGSRNETYRSQLREGRVNSEDNSHLSDDQSTHRRGIDSNPSSIISDDVLFDRYLAEANDLLVQAKECVRGRHDEEHAEVILYKSAKLLSKAVAMKPMSLMAVGQLGNTYLLHGELKLKFSRKLRAVLRGGDPLRVEKWGMVLGGLDDQLMNKDKVASILVNVCEECEELLVEAGRKYRLALSIDGNDVRALYNWGLALSFRAQLIADIGPEAAFDADKIFLAAIDKFDAMMSKGNVYTPDALFRWGVALQQRSHLRPSNSKEKVKLLQQARRLYEDALDMEPSNRQVREALSSCVSELNFRHF